MKKILLSISLLCSIVLTAQTLTGKLIYHAGQHISLSGFNYYDSYELAKTTTDSLGNFTLNYPKEYKGMGILKTQDGHNLVLLLDGNSLSLQGTHISEMMDLEQSEGQNKTFFAYALEHSDRKNALNAWKYLDRLYGESKNFTEQFTTRKVITEEIYRLKDRETKRINSLPKGSYLRWFIPYRSFIQDMPEIIRTETERIAESIALFRTTDFNHPNWKTNGILQEFIEKHYFMLENSSGTVEEKQEKMNKSSLHLIQNLASNQYLLNQVVANLFSFLEERSLFVASEFLANQVLKGAQCEIEEKTTKKLEKYRHLKVGRTAPDIQLSSTQKLSDFKQPILLVFGKSDCPHCKEGALELLKYHAEWKTKKNVEVVYISLDTDKTVYKQAFQNAPWLTFSDFKGWDSKAAKDYHIWGTPTYFLLDKELTILGHMNSVAHANAWITSRL